MLEQTQLIYHWYSKNKRNLPWRQTTDPYKIWISEIILQQTRVEQGREYYLRFIKRFPTLTDLALASEDEVLRMWQGLGYYTRARNLHATAKKIIDDHTGKFPNDYNTIRSLKGIGSYTAAAIASIAFDFPYPAIDGNVYRVLSRYFGVATPIDSTAGKKEFNELAQALMPAINPGLHNQAFMEFGALQCIPKNPDCLQCPLADTCYAAQHRQTDQLPVKSKKIKQRVRYFYYFLLEKNNAVYLEKRTANDIWKNLYQLPMVETTNKLTEAQALQLQPAFVRPENLVIKSISPPRKHVLSHQIIHARMIRAQITGENGVSNHLLCVNKTNISKFAVPKLVHHFLTECENPEK